MVKGAEDTDPCPALSDVPKGDAAFKNWAGLNLKHYSQCNIAYEVLLQCWEREATKRKK